MDEHVPCGIDVNTLTLNPNLTVLPEMDEVAKRIGIQLGDYYCVYLVILAHPSNLLIISLLSQTKLPITQPQQPPTGPLSRTTLAMAL